MHFKVDIVLHISEGWLALCLDTASLEKKGSWDRIDWIYLTVKFSEVAICVLSKET
jgi:hypothetical protein